MKKAIATILAVFLLFSLLGCSREIPEEDYWEAIWERRDAGQPLINEEEAEILGKYGFRYDPETEMFYDVTCNLPRGSYPVLLDQILAYNSGGLLLYLDMEKNSVVQFDIDAHYTGWEKTKTSSENGTVVLTETGFVVWEFGREKEIKGSFVGEFGRNGWAYLQDDNTLCIFKNGESVVISSDVLDAEAREVPKKLVFTREDGTQYYDFATGEVHSYQPQP